jgi:hypothetical protein
MEVVSTAVDSKEASHLDAASDFMVAIHTIRARMGIAAIRIMDAIEQDGARSNGDRSLRRVRIRRII